MNTRLLGSLAAGALMASVVGTAHADINGFGDLSGFSVNIGDAGSAPTVSPGTIHLITGGGQVRSVIDKTPQTITQFTASFTWQNATNYNDGGGATFVLENVISGATALGFNGGNLGYNGNGFYDSGGSGNQGKSAVITLETGPNPTASGFYSNGVLGGGSNSTAPVVLYSGHPINVALDYNGTTLQETLTDTVTLGSYSTSYFVNLPNILGASTAYVGVTAGSSSGGASQTFSNFQFSSGGTPVPEPASLALLVAASASMLLRRRRGLSAQ